MQTEQKLLVLEKLNDELMSVLMEYVEKYGLTDKAIAYFKLLRASKQDSF
ncbi:hypothetical protein [Sediminimonas qiaohouensis]|nr:hypothetical protein [Sediminimonas qiaohouensis]